MITRIRYWLISLLFTSDEHYLMLRAIQERCISLERIAVTERWADKDSIRADVDDYRKLQSIFNEPR